MTPRPRSPADLADEHEKRRAAWEQWRDRALKRLRASDPQGAAVLEGVLRSWFESDAAEPSAVAVGVASRFAHAPPPGLGT